MLKGEKEIETIIGPSVKVEGNFVAEGNVAIEGEVSGSIETKKDLRIGKGAKIKAEIKAGNVYVAGLIEGNIKAEGEIQLASGARVNGDLETKVLSIERGAIFNGKCVMPQEQGQ